MISSKLFMVLVVVGACAKNTPATAPPVKDPVPMTTAAPGSATPMTSSMQTLLAAYERVRSRLAADDLNGAADAAREIQAATTAFGESKATDFTEIANSAASLAAAKDIKAARNSFGEISRQVIALLATDKALTKTMHVFECPMVRGYKKWVQPTEDLQNPYMGKRMLACGGESSWN